MSLSSEYASNGEMTRELLKKICKQDKLYMTPSLNDKLYLNFKGFTAISCLEEYTGLKALFLEGNAIDTITLPRLDQLRCLYLQQNMIWEISGLEDSCPNLDTLNLSSNNISKIENLGGLNVLSTLQLANNRLESLESIQGLSACPSLTSLDLTNNRLSDPAVLEVFKAMPNLACLYLTGNPFVSNLRNYRKTLIASIPSLTYLDDRPVFDTERRCAEAWARGGTEGERSERERCKAEEKERERRNFEHMRQVREEAFRKRRELMGLPPGDSDPTLDDLSDGEWEFEGEPEELVRAREALAHYAGRAGEEEPPELTAARRQLASGGVAIEEATWQPIAGPAGEAADVRAPAPDAAAAVLAPSSSSVSMKEEEGGADGAEDGGPSTPPTFEGTLDGLDLLIDLPAPGEAPVSSRAKVQPGGEAVAIASGPPVSLDELD